MKKKKQYSIDIKKQAVADYVSDHKSITQVASEHGVTPSHVYKWKIQLDEKAKGVRIKDLEAQGLSTQAARKILQLEAEIEEYQKKVAQQAVIIDLLKKLQTPASSPPESELTGLIDTTKRLARSRKPVK